MGGGAWPFLVGGVICQVNSDNERDLTLLNSSANLFGQSRTDLAAAWRSRQCRVCATPALCLFANLLLRDTPGVAADGSEAITGL